MIHPRFVGTVHLPALPGSVRGGRATDLVAILDRARRDAATYAEGGASALIVENFGDVPFARHRVGAHVVAAMTLAVDAVRAETGLPIGVNVLRNDVLSAVSIAAMTGARFVRANMVNVLRASPWFGGTERDEHPSGDAALVAAARRDPEAFSALYRRYAAPVYRYCLRRLGVPETAEDAMSLIFSRAFANLRHCDENAFRPWLFTIAHNVVIDRHRATRPSAPLDAASDLLDDTPGPEHLAIAADERQTLAALLSHLTPDQRQVVELRLAGLTGVEIAATVGRSHDAVKKLQARALLKLRDLMGVASGDDAR